MMMMMMMSLLLLVEAMLDGRSTSGCVDSLETRPEAKASP